MVVFEYVLWIASQVLFLLLQVVLLWNIWTQGAFAGQGERVRRAVFLAWGGLLVLLALVMSFNLTLIWPRIPIDMAEGGQLAWAANLAGALFLLVSNGIVVVTVVRRSNRPQHQTNGV